MAAEFNLNETTEEITEEVVTPKKRGRKPKVQEVVEETPAQAESVEEVENDKIPVENTSEDSDRESEVESVIEDVVEEDTVEPEVVEEIPDEVESTDNISEEETVEEAIPDKVEEETPNEDTETATEEIEEEKPLINIEEETKEEVKETSIPKFIVVDREIVFTLPSVTAPKRTVSGRITILEDTMKRYYKVLYIAPGRGTDVGYIPYSTLEKYNI